MNRRILVLVGLSALAPTVVAAEPVGVTGAVNPAATAATLELVSGQLRRLERSEAHRLPFLVEERGPINGVATSCREVVGFAERQRRIRPQDHARGRLRELDTHRHREQVP